MKTHHLSLLFGLLTVMGSVPSVQADKLGRLFTTPQQRAMLDQTLRTEARSGQQKNATTKTTATVQQLKLNGTLLGSNGRRHVWINGSLLTGHRAPGGARIRILDSGHVRLRLPATGRSRIIKPGQLVDIASGRIAEAYLQTAAHPPPGDHSTAKVADE